MLMPSGTNQTTDALVVKQSHDLGGKQKRKKRKVDKEQFTSLNVACIKRLLPVGMNTFGGREQELVQLAKNKMIEVIIELIEHMNISITCFYFIDENRI